MRWMLPELGLVNVILFPLFLIIYLAVNLVIILTWPIWSLIRWAWRRHKRKQEQARRALGKARDADRLAESLAAKERIEEENHALQAAGHYVPGIDDRDIRTICKNVIYYHGKGQAMWRANIGPEAAHETIARVQAAFGSWSLRLLGIDLRELLHKKECATFIAIAALDEVCRCLTIVNNSDGEPLIGARQNNTMTGGILGSIALGVFTRVADTSPSLDFSHRIFFDYFYVASSFTPSRESIDAASEYRMTPPSKRWSTELPVIGVFDARLVWLMRIFRNQN